MQGGGKGLLVNNTNLCKAKPKANVEFDGQNGKTEETNPLVSVGGCGKGGKKKCEGGEEVSRASRPLWDSGVPAEAGTRLRLRRMEESAR